MPKTLADYVKQKSYAVFTPDKIAYCDQPYRCCLAEALTYFKNYAYPAEDKVRTEMIDKNTLQIDLFPKRGNSRKACFTMRIWITN